MERWSEMVATEGGNSKFYSEIKGIIRQRVDFDKATVEEMIKGLP